MGLRVLGLGLVVIFVLIASGALPRRSPYGARAMFTSATNFGGMAGRIAWYGRGNVDLLDPLLAYRFELETELSRRLGLSRPSVEQLGQALTSRGVAPKDVALGRALIDELREVAERADRGTVEPVNLTRLKDAMRRGDALLATVRAPSAPPPAVFGRGGVS